MRKLLVGILASCFIFGQGFSYDTAWELKGLGGRAPQYAVNYLFHKAFFEKHKKFLFKKIQKDYQKLLGILQREVDLMDDFLYLKKQTTQNSLI